MRWFHGSLLLAGTALALSGCGSATNNGLAPQAENTYPVPSAIPVPRNDMASVPAALPPIAVSPPVLRSQPVQAVPEVNYSSTTLPLTPLSTAVPSVPSVSSMTQSVAAPITQAANHAQNSVGQALNQVQSTVGQTVRASTSGFSGEWQKDMTKARQDSAKCAALRATAQSTCWQGVSDWAKARSTAYKVMGSTATGAQAQQMQSASKFFGVTGEWASACSSLSSQSCAESPLISKMQQWKASVGIPGN